MRTSSQLTFGQGHEVRVVVVKRVLNVGAPFRVEFVRVEFGVREYHPEELFHEVHRPPDELATFASSPLL